MIGNRTRVRIVKNKIAPPFREAEFDILYGKGISYLGEVIDLGAEHGVIKRSGTWYSFGEERLGQGREKVMAFLAENPDLRQEIEIKVRETLGLPVSTSKSANVQ